MLSEGKLTAQPVLAGERRLVKNKIKLELQENESYVVALKVEIAGSSFEKIFRIDNP